MRKQIALLALIFSSAAVLFAGGNHGGRIPVTGDGAPFLPGGGQPGNQPSALPPSEPTPPLPRIPIFKPTPIPTPIDPEYTEWLSFSIDNGAPAGRYHVEAYYDPNRKTVLDLDLEPNHAQIISVQHLAMLRDFHLRVTGLGRYSPYTGSFDGTDSTSRTYPPPFTVVVRMTKQGGQ